MNHPFLHCPVPEAGVPQRPSEPPAREVAVAIVRTLRDAGHAAYLAGGCVRDELLGFEPKDFDVATDATPDRVRSLFRRTQAVGAAFGVVLVREGPVTVEVATFRRDGPYSDRRRPDSIEFADARADALRRDFTINALFLDPLSSGTVNGSPGTDEGARTLATGRGVVIDFVGGLEDLHARLIRAVGEPAQRLAEDHLRALRAVRFASRYGFTIEDQTAEAIRHDARQLAGVSRERIGDEVRRMISHPSRGVSAWTIQYLALDEPIFGTHTTRAPMLLGRLDDSAPYPTCLAAWAIDRGAIVEASQVAGVVDGWRRALCLSNRERDDLKAILLGVGMLTHEWARLGVAAQKRAAASSWFDEAMRIIAAQTPEGFVRIHRRVEQLMHTPSGLSPDPLINGDDLLKIGFRSGPRFQDLLDAIYDAQLEDRINTRDEALALARELGPTLGVQSE